MTMRASRALLFTFTVAGCVGEVGDTSGDDEGSDEEMEPVVCEQARTHAGFGGPLEAGRLPIAPGSDRLRVKPFGALSAEYMRALGLPAFDTTPYAATFGRAPGRWFNEPQASANTIYAAFALAYGACSAKTATGGDFTMAPAPAIADRLCGDFARAAWQREPSAAELAACTTYVLDKTKPTDAPAKRWAYGCAAVLTASGFLAY